MSTPTDRTFPSRADLALIPVELDEDGSSGSFVLTSGLARHDGAMYGGTGAAAAVMAMEAATQRDALWVVTQFVAQAQTGERVRWVVEPMALGGRIAQLRVTGTAGDRIVFCALGATAHPRPGGLHGQYRTMPVVSPPDDSSRVRPGPPQVDPSQIGFHRKVEFREVAQPAGTASGSVLLWARLTSGALVTRATVAFLADMIPLAVARAAGRMGAGFSLDNSLRFADVPPSEWVLLELTGQVAVHGYGHGDVTVWSDDGSLIATGSQTASMTFLFDPDEVEARRTLLGDAAT
jgi:acyl-CoA thioesterase II